MVVTCTVDGTSDAGFARVVRWIISDLGCHQDIYTPVVTVSDIKRAGLVCRSTADRVIGAVKLYPCDILVVHRDTEADSVENRMAEIARSIAQIPKEQMPVAWLGLVPQRMQESWKLLDSAAIRSAAGNPNGTMPLVLPRASTIERSSNPKATLNTLLATASGQSGRRLRKFDRAWAAKRVFDFMDDYSTLRALDSYIHFESQMHEAVVTRNICW